VKSVELIPKDWLWPAGRYPKPTPLSRDLRERIVRAVEGGASIRQATLRFDVSPSAAVKLMRHFHQSGSPAPVRFDGHRRPILESHEALVRALLDAKADILLREIYSAPFWTLPQRRAAVGCHALGLLEGHHIGDRERARRGRSGRAERTAGSLNDQNAAFGRAALHPEGPEQHLKL